MLTDMKNSDRGRTRSKTRIRSQIGHERSCSNCTTISGKMAIFYYSFRIRSFLSTEMETWHLCKDKLISRRGHLTVNIMDANFCFQLDHYGRKVSF